MRANQRRSLGVRYDAIWRTQIVFNSFALKLSNGKNFRKKTEYRYVSFASC